MNASDLSAATIVAPAVNRARLRHHPLLGGLLVKEGLINESQLERALQLQQETESRPLLGQVLLDHKLVTPHELNSVLAKYQRKHLLGDVLVETKAITPAELETALAAQRRTGVALGDALVQLGFITERQLKHALAIQLRIPLVELDERPIDPDLRSLLSESYARHHRVLPIARLDDRIVLVMDDPADLEVVAEVQSCAGQRIDIATATREEIERGLVRLYGEPRETPATSRPSGIGASAAPLRSAVSMDAIRARMDAIRQLARSWERSVDAVDSLMHERGEGRAEIERLSGELRECRAALAEAQRELDAKTEALTRLEATYDAVARERDALGHALAALRTRHDALLEERKLAIEQLTAVLRRLTS